MEIALLADIHLGVKKSDRIFQESQLKFFKEQLVPELKEKEIDTIAFLGDIFDTRQSVNTNTMNVVYDLFTNVLKDFDIHVIVGNHDLYYTTTTEVNSLKWLELIPNVHIYTEPTKVKFGEGENEHEVLMLPWVTDYTEFEKRNISAEYVFAHLDISGMKMDKYNFCTSGVTIKGLFDRFEHIYTGHFHTRSEKKQGKKNITYIGSPYQMIRSDSGDARGYTILSLDNNKTQLVENTKSMKFKVAVFPNDIDDIENFTRGNVVDVHVSYEDSKYSKKIYEYMKNFEQYGPAYPVNLMIQQRTDLTPVENDIEGINLYSLMKEYVDADDEIPKDDKDKVYNELIRLYTEFKGQ